VSESGRPHVVIVGAGFGGLCAAKALAKADVRVTVVDRRNHHVFQPLLYQVATAALTPTQIAAPIRTVLRRQQNAAVLLAEVVGVDAERREVQLSGGRALAYDHLILATGARHSYFGRDDWESCAPGLKSLEDALALRRRILLAFERAELAADPAEHDRLLTFVIIGGGPTGVEMAGAIAELARKALLCDFRTINPRQARVVLVEAGPRVLGGFPERLSAYAQAALERLGVEVRLGQAVTGCDSEGIEFGETRIGAGTVVWAAGVMASPAARWLGVAADRAGRAMVAPDLTIPGRPEVSVIGDAAHVAGPDGRPLPGLAPVAKQQGDYAARAIQERLARRTPGPFSYRDYGALATVGRRSAVVDLRGLRLTGSPGWLLWSVAHVYYLIGFRNRIGVALDWIWSYLTFERGARLITGDQPEMGAPARTHEALAA
jgi:NADH:ubiquinone reductase (H+-translocating)